MKDYLLLQKKYLVPTYSNRGLTLVEGEGVYLKDVCGEMYLDLMTNYGVNIFGHVHPLITRRLTDQLRRLTTLHGSFANDTRAEAVQRLVNRCGGGLSQAFVSNSGAEANEAALKFAVLATGKRKFIRCWNGYHGKTLGSLSATDGKKYREPFEPLLWHFTAVAYDDLSELEAALDHETAAFIVEPVQGESGVRVPREGYLESAAEMCRSKGALLILDEVQTGVGRTGFFLASDFERSTYDIITLGKGLAGGIPVGATLVSESVAEKIPRSSHTSTFGGNPLAAAGILAVLDLLDDERLAHILKVGGYLLEGLRSMRSDLVVEARGAGLMLGLEVRERRDEVLKELQRARILAIPAGENVIRLLPPYILEKAHVDVALDKIARVFSVLSPA